MNAAGPNRPSADEPILLTEAELEHVMDAFLPEGPDGGTANAPARSKPPAIDLFASERAEDDEHGERPMRIAAESLRPWRTYPTEDQSHGVDHAAAPTSVPAVVASQPLGRRAIAAVALAGVAAIIGISLQPRLSPLTAPVEGNREQLTSVSPAVASVRAPQAAVTARTVTEARREVARDAPAASVLPPEPTGAALKGSLTPGPPLVAAREIPVSPPLDAMRTALPITPAIAPARSMRVPSAASEPTSPAAVAPVGPPPSPSAPPLTRDAASASATEPPPAHSAPAPSTAAPAAAETASIESVLGRYREAFTALDANAARAVWPGVDARALGRAFDQLVQQQLDFEKCEIVITSPHATAACGGRARYVPRVGSRSMRDEPRHWTFSLQKVNGRWVIERVVSR